VWRAQTLVLGRPGRRYVELSVRIPALGEEMIIVIPHNAKAFHCQIILHKDILLKWQVDLIMNGFKIMCMRKDHFVFLDIVSFLPFALSKLPEVFGLTVTKSWYPHYFNTQAKLIYVGKIPDVSYYGINEMSTG